MINFVRRYQEGNFFEIYYFEFGPVVQEEKSFKNTYFMYSSGGLFVQYLLTICTIMLEGIMRNTFVKRFEFGTVAQEEILFKDISHLELWQPFVQQSRAI